jgi:hypothetical protein
VAAMTDNARKIAFRYFVTLTSCLGRSALSFVRGSGPAHAKRGQTP